MDTRGYIPRDIYEVAKLFEDLLFMRTNKFMAKESGDPKLSLSRPGEQLLGQLGITGRIFRRWYQTNWGWDNPSEFFKGETPRMELARRYKGLSSGDSYIGVQLVQNELNEVKVVPSLYEKNEINKACGIYRLGLSFLPEDPDARNQFKSLPPPNYDPWFKDFVSDNEEMENNIRRESDEALPSDKERRAWQIFWPDACINVILNSEFELPHIKLIEMSSVFRMILEFAIQEQSQKSDRYIYIGQLFEAIWNMFCEFDSKLLPIDIMLGKDHKSISNIMKRPHGPYSFNIYYNFTNLFDELLLFPADRYFGAVECVWTDQASFLNDLIMTTILLNNNLILPQSFAKLSKEQKTFSARTAIEKKVTDIHLIWFSPMTCFRILPKFLPFFDN